MGNSAGERQQPVRTAAGVQAASPGRDETAGAALARPVLLAAGEYRRLSARDHQDHGEFSPLARCITMTVSEYQRLSRQDRARAARQEGDR
jgi:hypothetical protein